LEVNIVNLCLKKFALLVELADLSILPKIQLVKQVSIPLIQGS
jgi:hypothetical protein